MPHVNAAGLALIKEFEGCVLHAYPDPGTGGKPWTIGYGHTGPEVHLGLVITQDQADALLASDLHSFEVGVNGLVTHSCTPNQFAALVSFAFNVGLGALQGSTLLKYFNQGHIPECAEQFLQWTHAGGQVLSGLVRRREAEKALFLKDDS